MPAGTAKTSTLLTPILIVFALGGCATPAFVQTEVDGVGQRLDTLHRLLLDTRERLDAQAGQIAAAERRLGLAENAQAVLNTKLADANRRLEQLGADAAQLGKTGEAHASTLGETRRNIDSIDQRMNAVVAQTGTSLTSLADLGERLADLESEIATLKTMLPDAGEPGGPLK